MSIEPIINSAYPSLQQEAPSAKTDATDVAAQGSSGEVQNGPSQFEDNVSLSAEAQNLQPNQDFLPEDNQENGTDTPDQFVVIFDIYA